MWDFLFVFLKKLILISVWLSQMLLKTEASGFSFLPQAISFLERLLEFNAYDVLLITELSSAAEKGQVVDLFSSSSLAASGLFDIRKLLFCTTVDGRVHMVRHLEPVVHVEGPLVKLPKDSPMERLWQFIPRMIRVGRPETALKKTAVDSWDSKPDVPVEGGNVETVDSLMNSSLAKEIGFAKAGSW